MQITQNGCPNCLNPREGCHCLPQLTKQPLTINQHSQIGYDVKTGIVSSRTVIASGKYKVNY